MGRADGPGVQSFTRLPRRGVIQAGAPLIRMARAFPEDVATTITRWTLGVDVDRTYNDHLRPAVEDRHRLADPQAAGLKATHAVFGTSIGPRGHSGERRQFRLSSTAGKPNVSIRRRTGTTPGYFARRPQGAMSVAPASRLLEEHRRFRVVRIVFQRLLKRDLAAALSPNTRCCLAMITRRFAERPHAAGTANSSSKIASLGRFWSARAMPYCWWTKAASG